MLQQIVFHILCSRGIEWILRIFPHSQNGIAAEQVDDVESAESIGARFPVVEGAVAADELLYLVPVQVHVVRHAELEEHSESPFESAVAKSLSDRGYHLVQQWKVGAYRIDMVAVNGKKTVVK